LDKEELSRDLLSELRKVDDVHDKIWQKVLRIRANKRNEEYLMEDESPEIEESSYRQESKGSARARESPVPANLAINPKR
jgi:hypothetical protein